jgi:hypothetical protein
LEPSDRRHQPGAAPIQQFLDSQTSRFDSLIACDPHRAAIKLLASLTQREALVLTFNDLLLLLGTLFVFGRMLSLLEHRGAAP